MSTLFNNCCKTIKQILLLTIISTIIGCTGPKQAPEPVVKKQSWTGFDYLDINIGNQKRKFLLRIPDSYTGKSPVPLLFDFHGSASTAFDQVSYSDFEEIAEEKGFILVAPAGIRMENSKAKWNTTLDPRHVDDIGLIKELIRSLSEKLAIDKKRIFASGMSGGARMVSRMACELSDTFAAIAPVAGIQFPDDCTPSRSMPVITFHGKADLVNHYAQQSNSPSYWNQGVEDSVKGWVNQNGCSKDPHSEKISEVVTKLTWKDCTDDVEVVFYQIEDGGHTWPGSPTILTYKWSGKTNKDIVASELIWNFFMVHPLPKDRLKN